MSQQIDRLREYRSRLINECCVIADRMAVEIPAGQLVGAEYVKLYDRLQLMQKRIRIIDAEVDYLVETEMKLGPQMAPALVHAHA